MTTKIDRKTISEVKSELAVSETSTRRRRPRRISPDDLPAELARVASLDAEGLRLLWLNMTGSPPSRQLSGDLLRRLVMHRVQERTLGALDRKLATMLDRLADGSRAPPSRLKVGSTLVREHDGIVHQVTVVPDRFVWNDCVLPSLSAAARAITGTRWNGYRFFGVRRTSANDRAVEARS